MICSPRCENDETDYEIQQKNLCCINHELRYQWGELLGRYYLDNSIMVPYELTYGASPDSKVHMANMGPTWVLSAPDGPHDGPMNLAIRVYV